MVADNPGGVVWWQMTQDDYDEKSDERDTLVHEACPSPVLHFVQAPRGKGGIYLYTYACKAGSSGMRFNEGERHLVESERVVKQSNTQWHMPQKTSISVRYHFPSPHLGYPTLSYPVVVCVAP